VLERRRRIDQVLYAVVMEAHVHWVSARNVDNLVQALGVDAGISKSEVSRICAGLDEEMTAFRERPLSDLSFPYVLCDATYVKSRFRRSREGRSQALEARTMKFVRSQCYPVPEVFEVSGDGIDLEMARIESPTMMEAASA